MSHILLAVTGFVTCSAIFDFDFSAASVLSNDLGDLGPSTTVTAPGSAQTLTFQWPDGPTLSFKNTSVYEAGDIGKNGLNGKFASISVRAGTCVNLEVTVAVPPNTDLSYYFSLLDVDGGSIAGVAAANREMVTIDGFREYFVDANPKMETFQNANGSMTLKSIQAAGAEDASNPTAAEMPNAITFLFSGQNDFNMRLCADATPDATGREFLFSGSTALVTTVNPICQGSKLKAQSQAMFDFTTSEVLVNDLQGETHNLRIGKVGNIRGRSVDLQIVAESEYNGADATLNGLQGKFGIINVRNNASVDLLFKFIDSESSEEIAISNFYFGFFDFDQLPSGEGREVLTVHEPNLNYRVGQNSTIQVTTTGIDTQFKSTQVGSGEDNPTDPMEMTFEQKAKGLVMLFRERSSFRATLTVEGGPQETGRNFEFAGFAPSVDPTCGTNNQIENEIETRRRSRERKFLSAKTLFPDA